MKRVGRVALLLVLAATGVDGAPVASAAERTDGVERASCRRGFRSPRLQRKLVVVRRHRRLKG